MFYLILERDFSAIEIQSLQIQRPGGRLGLLKGPVIFIFADAL